MTSPPAGPAPPAELPDEAEPAPVPRLELANPLPPVTDTDDALADIVTAVAARTGPRPLDAPGPPVPSPGAALADIVTAVAAGTGPVALDAERASGYRYSQRAYLVQLRREGTGTVLVDPVADADPLEYLSP